MNPNTPEQSGQAPLQADLDQLSDQELAAYQQSLREAVELVARGAKPLTDEVARVEAHVQERFSEAVSVAYSREKKKSGKLNIKREDGFVIEANISKTVKWDSDKLKAVAQGMSWEEIQHYFKIDFSVSEAIFKALPPGPIRDAITNARTTNYGDPKVKLSAPQQQTS